MSFTESNTVEQMFLDAATSLGSGAGSSVLREDPPAGWGGSLGEEFKPSRWSYVAATALPRQPGEVMVEPWVREALISLNPEIAGQPGRQQAKLLCGHWGCGTGSPHRPPGCVFVPASLSLRCHRRCGRPACRAAEDLAAHRAGQLHGRGRPARPKGVPAGRDRSR